MDVSYVYRKKYAMRLAYSVTLDIAQHNNIHVYNTYSAWQLFLLQQFSNVVGV